MDENTRISDDLNTFRVQLMPREADLLRARAEARGVTPESELASLADAAIEQLQTEERMS